MQKPLTASVEVGTEFSGPPRKLSVARVLAFSGGPIDAPDWPAKNLHTDHAKAVDAGLPRRIASGLQFEGHLVELLYELFGQSWLRSGSLQVRYPRPVVIDDIVQAVVRVTEVEPLGSEVRISLDARCSRADGEKVLVGVAHCLLPSPNEIAP